MSKIYEALRQAELDRANSGVAPSDSSKATGQAVLDHENVATADLNRTATPLATVAPISKHGLLGAALADTKTNPENAIAPPQLAERSAFDLLTATPHLWSPVYSQFPALEERGSAVEQFRSLRSRLQEFRDLNKIKSVLVSSGLPQEGKSFIAANLAISLARHKGGKVLLIDGDMRRARLHTMLGTDQGPGLTEYLAGGASIAEIVQSAAVGESGKGLPVGMSSLYFIPAGNEHDKAGDLSGNHRFEKLITAVAPSFDWIIVDSSTVNLVSDGVNLARSCDAVLLVARGGVTKYEAAQRAVAELKASKLVGVVLNAVRNPVAAGGYYGYDGYDKIEA